MESSTPLASWTMGYLDPRPSGAIFQQRFLDVLRPKIDGARWLDELTQQDSISCFVMFSSLASVLGNAGQTDYAYGNGFLDGFALYREALRGQGKRSGQSLAINWPLWREGGMSIPERQILAFQELTGITPLHQDDGLAVLASALSDPSAPGGPSGTANLAVAPGDAALIEAALNRSGSQLQSESAPAPASSSVGLPVEELSEELAGGNSEKGNLELQGKVQEFLVATFAKLLRTPEGDLDVEQPFLEYGVDSFLGLRILKTLEKEVGRLPQTLLFEADSLAELTARLVADHKEAWQRKFPALAEPIRTREAPAPVANGPDTSGGAERPAGKADPVRASALSYLVDVFAESLRTSPESLDIDEPFLDFGVDSFLSLRIVKTFGEEIRAPASGVDVRGRDPRLSWRIPWRRVMEITFMWSWSPNSKGPMLESRLPPTQASRSRRGWR